MIEQHWLEAKPVTAGDKHHFFGYYDKFPWNASGRYLLGMQVDFIDRQPTADDAATIGLIDTQDNHRWIPLDETRAWCWQQGTMLQWLPSASENTIIYNQRIDNQFCSVIRNIETGETLTLPRPIYCLNPQRDEALSINFARLHRTRPGYGYVGVDDAGKDDPHPQDDGIYHINLKTGEDKLILSYKQLRNFNPKDTMASGQHWFNHLLFAPDASRFVFLHRWQHPSDGGRNWVDRLVSAKPDGTDLCVVADDGFVSHFDYYSPRKILAWSRQNAIGNRYFMYTDCDDEVSIVGNEVFSTDGHCSFSPDRQWMLTDTYPDDEQKRTLMLYHLESETRIDIGRFYAPPELTGATRCDLHPRWSRDGRQVCIDSAHEKQRHMYVIDVSPVLDKFN